MEQQSTLDRQCDVQIVGQQLHAIHSAAADEEEEEDAENHLSTSMGGNVQPSHPAGTVERGDNSQTTQNAIKLIFHAYQHNLNISSEYLGYKVNSIHQMCVDQYFQLHDE